MVREITLREERGDGTKSDGETGEKGLVFLYNGVPGSVRGRQRKATDEERKCQVRGLTKSLVALKQL